MTATEPRVRHERSDVRPLWIVLAGLVMLALGILLHFQMAALFDFFARREAQAKARPAPVADHVPASAAARAEPRLQVEPRRDLERLRATEERLLHSYGWVDRPAGIAHIPIDRAMEIVAQEGTGARK